MYIEHVKKGIDILYKRYTILIPIIISLIVSLPIGFSRVFPLWSDPGEWLKYAKAYEAVILHSIGIEFEYTRDILNVMGEQIVFGYPPLSLFLISIYRAILGDVPGVQYLGATLLILQPIPNYLIAYRITKEKWIALLAGVFTALTPGYLEIFGWGGYPNLLGLIFIGLSLYYLIGYIKDEEPIWKALATSVLIVFTHHLSTAIYISIVFIWAILNYLSKKDLLKFFRISSISIITGATLAIYRFGLGFLEDYVIFNEAAFYELRVDYIRMVLWIFKEPVVFTVGIVAVILGMYRLYKVDKEVFNLFISWVIAPFLLTFGYLFGIALDYNRFLLFLTQPIPILLPLILYGRRFYLWELLIHWRRKLSSIILIAFIAGYLVLYTVNGFNSSYVIASWYTYQDKYGWWGRHDALTWIRDNTLPTDVFAADELMGRWIEGYSHRKAYINTDPKWLFRKGQVDEYYVSSSIYGGIYEYRSPSYRIFVQGDVNPRYSIYVNYWRYGDYEPAFYIPIPDIVDLYDPYKPGTPVNVTTSNTISIDERGFTAVYQTNKSITVIQRFMIIDEKTVYIRTSFINKTSEYLGLPLKLDKNLFISFTIEGEVIKLKYDNGFINITVPDLYDAYLLPWEHDKLMITFESNTIEMYIRFTTRENRMFRDLYFNDIWSLAEEYGVTHVVISIHEYRDRNSKYYFLGRIFEVAYNNGFVVILKIDR